MDKYYIKEADRGKNGEASINALKIGLIKDCGTKCSFILQRNTIESQ